MVTLKQSNWLRSLPLALALGGAMLVAPSAFAGEVKFAAEAFDTDDSGKLTEAGRSAAVKELPSLPGEDVWVLHLWAKIDKGAPGPLYVEFFDKLPGSGKRYKAWAYEHSNYQGDEHVTLEMELEGNVGFNRDHTYTVELVQVDAKGKNLQLASGQVKLVYTEAKEEPEGEDEGEDEDDDEGDDPSAQDELDSFAGGDAPESGNEGPPPVAPPASKKGCSVDPGLGVAPGILVMMVLGASVARRRR